jgi:hypothetical protein
LYNLLLSHFLPSLYQRAFTDTLSLADNPIAVREMRRDDRRREPFLLALITLLTLLTGLILAMALVKWRQESIGLRNGIPAWLGGSYGALLLASISAIHVWFVMHASRRRTHAFFLQEYRQNTLPALLMTPVPPFQIILQASVHPFLQGMVIAAAGLPFYAFAASLGGVRPLDIPMLYLLFAMIAFAPPRWFVPVFGGLDAEEIQKRKQGGRGTGSMDTLIGWLIILTSLSPFTRWIFGGFGMINLLIILWQSLPRDLGLFLLPFPLTWAVCTARWLYTPSSFYALSLPPVLLILPLFLFARTLRIWESSMYLRIGDQEQIYALWDMPTYWRARAVYGSLLAFTLLGLFWKPFVASQLTSAMVSPLAASPTLSLMGLIWLGGWWVGLTTWGRLRTLFRPQFQQAATLSRNTQRSSRDAYATRRANALYLVSPFLTVLSLYTAACLLALRNPFPLSALTMWGQIALVTLLGALLTYALAPRTTGAYIALLLIPLAGFFSPYPSLNAVLCGLSALSPLTGILCLTPHTQRIASHVAQYFSIQAAVPTWNSYLLWALGLTLLSALLRLWRQHNETARRSSVAAATHSNEELTPRPDTQKRDYPAALRLIAWIQQHTDNPVLVKEVRVLFRGRLTPVDMTLIGLMLTLLPGAAFYYADVSRFFLEGMAKLFFGDSVFGYGTICGGLIVSALLLMAAVSPFLGASVCGAALGRERDKSTLGFVLVSPLTTQEILVGKLLGTLAPSLLTGVVLIVWSLLLLPGVLIWGGSPIRVVAGYLLLLALPMILLLMGGLIGLTCATLLRKESDSVGLAVLLSAGYVVAIFVTFFHLPFPESLPLLSGPAGWVLWESLYALLLIPICLRVMHWRMQRARRGDVAFESAQRQT